MECTYVNVQGNVRFGYRFKNGSDFFLTSDVLKFDNTFSWTRSKEVFYSVKVLPPESELSGATPNNTEATPTQTDTEQNCVETPE